MNAIKRATFVLGKGTSLILGAGSAGLDLVGIMVVAAQNIETIVQGQTV